MKQHMELLTLSICCLLHVHFASCWTVSQQRDVSSHITTSPHIWTIFDFHYWSACLPEPGLTPPTLLTFHSQHTAALPRHGKVSRSNARHWSPPFRALCLVAFDLASCCERTCYDPLPVTVLEDDSVMIQSRLGGRRGGEGFRLFWSERRDPSITW